MPDSHNHQLMSLRNGAVSLVKRLVDAGFEALFCGEANSWTDLESVYNGYNVLAGLAGINPLPICASVAGGSQADAWLTTFWNVSLDRCN